MIISDVARKYGVKVEDIKQAARELDIMWYRPIDPKGRPDGPERLDPGSVMLILREINRKASKEVEALWRR